MARSNDWYGILEACRRLASRPPNHFTSAQLAREAQIQPTRSSDALHLASAWCSKFKKWGYLVTVDSVPSSGRSWNVWTVTDEGMRREFPKTRFMVGKSSHGRRSR
jgi:hypothetical protein